MKQEENKSKLRVPYASPGQADKALDIFRRISPKKINSKFVVDNNITTASNAFKIIDLLKWFEIIDDDGNVNEEIARKLKLVGDERERFIVELIKTSYNEIFENANPTNATKDDIVNYIVHNYGFGQAQAKYATGLFLHLCQKYNIEMAEDLKKKVYKRTAKNIERTKKLNSKSKETNIKQENLTYSGQGAIISIRAPGMSFDLPINDKEELQEIIDKKLKVIYEAVKALLPEKKERIEEGDDTHR